MAVRAHLARAGDADEGGEVDAPRPRVGGQAVEHRRQPAHRAVAVGRVVGMAPLRVLQHARAAADAVEAEPRLDDPAADVGAADVHGEEGLAPQRGRWRQLHPAQQPTLVAVVAEHAQAHAGAGQRQQPAGAADGQPARLVPGEAAAKHDVPDAAPLRLGDEGAHHRCQRARVLLDRKVDHVGRVRIAADQHQVDLALAQFVGGRAPEGIAPAGAVLAARLVEQLAEGRLAGAVADEATFGMAQGQVPAVDGQAPAALGGVSCHGGLRREARR